MAALSFGAMPTALVAEVFVNPPAASGPLGKPVQDRTAHLSTVCAAAWHAEFEPAGKDWKVTRAFAEEGGD